MLNLSQVRELLKDRRHIVVSSVTGVNRQTIKRVAAGNTCSIESLEKLSSYFENQMNFERRGSKRESVE